MEYSDLYVMRIRQLCTAQHLSINRLATISGVKQSTLDNIMRGITKNPGMKTLHKVANVFSMTLAEFLNSDGLNRYSFENEDEE